MKITKNNIDDVFKSPKCSVETMELKGYELLQELFVDSSGFGQYDEMALTKTGFIYELENLLAKHNLLYSTITNEGQFQVYVGLFTKTGKKISKRIANNVLEIDYPTKDVIRLYDTDIVTMESDHITLNSGGFQTVTTKKWINKYLPQGVNLYQKDFNWYISDSRDNTVKEFVDGITIAN